MIRTLLLIASAFAFVSGKAQVTTADGYFNLASKEYVKQDKIQALRTLDKGLAQYPGDPKLLKLAEELIKEDEKKQQEQEQKQNEDQEKKDQQDQEKNDQQQKEEKDKEQEQKEQEQKEQEQKKEQEQGQDGKEQEQQEKKPQPGTIAPQDAMRMLEALDREEQGVQEKVREKLRPSNPQKIEKDW
ncbi:MAG: hypothetical protein KBA60_03180 [Flavobacteriales bacterium]|nr:hypothetical protein [Flavobacteriales bacterium]MBP6642425.1 hypothetical protein [Flavobacteriales bacterium]MBP7154984.1 hypothetical protein [Flavobacteriales bacterium]HQV74485.1 hypothetical protein [Flavobacteriales bacterium]HQW40030.1 hypothetical protein [Flavobacteriales bacterium]